MSLSEFATGEVFTFAALAEQVQRLTPAPAPRETLSKLITSPAGGPTHPFTTSGGGGPGVWDLFAEAAAWADLLEPVGWTRVQCTDSATEEAWRRPDASHPTTAKVLKANPHVLVNWSDSAGLPTGGGQKLTKARVYADLHYGGDLSAASSAVLSGTAPHVPPGVALALSTAQTGGATAPLGAVEDEGEPFDADAVREKFPAIDWHVLFAADVEDEFIHNPLLPAGRSVVIVSPPKAGKSLLAQEMAVTLHLGLPFLGYTPTRRYRVLYVDHENDPRGDVRQRFAAMGYGPDDLAGLAYLSFPVMAPLDSHLGGGELLAAAKAYDVEVVIIDTVSRTVEGEENSNDTWLKFYRRAALPLKRAGIALVRLDHTGKDETKGMRGGSAKAGDVDAIWRLTKITDSRLRLDCTESRMHLDTKSITLTRHPEPLHHTAAELFDVTTTEAKTLELIALLDGWPMPDDANREAVRHTANAHGLKVSQTIIQDVVKRRKARAEG